MNSWILHVKNFASKKGIKYNEALKDPECKLSYKKGAGVVVDGVYSDRGSSRPVAVAVKQGDGLGIVKKYIAVKQGDGLGIVKKYISL